MSTLAPLLLLHLIAHLVTDNKIRAANTNQPDIRLTRHLTHTLQTIFINALPSNNKPHNKPVLP